MHADIHLQLHQLHAAELHRAAATTAPRVPGPALRIQLGWRLVELGMRLATPAHQHPVGLAA
ncbi:hypothetical protein ACFVDH_02340 [Streptomyces sp. NPDC057674]|uniref:hypothetical protein n=1 Tax=Streptomyces sp. NPDC057674 TaxID=3346203 RepID=UPI0036A05BC0